MHGVGLSVVNALSEELEVKVYRKGFEYSQKYKKGIVKTKLKKTKCSLKNKGTQIIFKPDKNIFEDINFNPSKIYNIIKTVKFNVSKV